MVKMVNSNDLLVKVISVWHSLPQSVLQVLLDPQVSVEHRRMAYFVVTGFIAFNMWPLA